MKRQRKLVMELSKAVVAVPPKKSNGSQKLICGLRSISWQISIDEKYAEWIGPTVFIGGSLLLQNPTILNIALNQGFCPLCKARAKSVRYQKADGFCQRSDHGPEPLAVLLPMRGSM